MKFSKFANVLKLMYEENYEKKMHKKKVKFDRNQMPRANVEGSNTNLEVFQEFLMIFIFLFRKFSLCLINTFTPSLTQRHPLKFCQSSKEM